MIISIKVNTNDIDIDIKKKRIFLELRAFSLPVVCNN